MSRELDALDFIQDEPRYSNDIKYRNAIDLIRSALIEKEDLDNANPSEALTEIFNIIYNLDCGTTYEQDKKLDVCRKTIKQALIKAQENEEENYVIYCINNYHNIYMDYRGEPCNYQSATIFNNKFEAHKFLREKGNYDYYHWSVFNVKDLREDQEHRQ